MTAATRSLAQLLNDGWEAHDAGAEQLARELEAAVDEITLENVAPFVHLSTHTIGEHLGDWARAVRLGKRVLDGRAPSSESARAWGRLYVAAVLAGDSVDAVEAAELELTCLIAAGDDFSSALLDMRFMLATALIGSSRAREGANIYRGALELSAHVQQSPALDRTIAVASNNIGWELYEQPARTADENALMKLAAETSHACWLRCGNWINEERALHLEAVVANAIGDPAAGLESADAALAIIESNGERPLDAARLHLARSESFRALGDAPGRAMSLADADAIAARIADSHLREQFAIERASVLKLVRE